jgi:V/A-type H+-transporting ATPase subunit C
MSNRTYIGARAAALRGTLLDRQTIEKLAEAATLEEFVNRLKATPYSDAMSGLSPPFSARRLELSMRERLAKIHFTLMNAASKYAILRLYYDRHIAWDLKAALKAKALGRSYEETIEYIDMKAEELVGRRELIVKVLSSKDVQEASSLLAGTEFHRDVERAVASFSTKGEVRFFDVYIDHTVLSRVSKEYASNYKMYSSHRAGDVSGIGDMVANDIDSYNVLSVLRSKLWGLQEQDVRSLIITPTYRVPLPTLTRMIASDSVAEAAKLVENVYPVSTQAHPGDEQLIDAVEESATERMKETASKAFVWQGLGPAGALALIKLLEFEVSNLASIAIGIEAKIPAKRILEKLIL